MAKGKKSAHYIDNSEFLEVMKEYHALVVEAQEKGELRPIIPDYVGECFMKIAQRLSFRPNFINYAFREDMISDGIENCLQYVENFNPEKSKNPFAYFTQIIYYAFIRRIQKEKKQTHIRNEMISKQDYQAYTTMEGDDTGYTVRGFDPHLMVSDEPVYKTKSNEVIKKKGLENFMETDELDSVAERSTD